MKLSTKAAAILILMLFMALAQWAAAAETGGGPFFGEPHPQTETNPVAVSMAVSPPELGPGESGFLRVTLSIAPGHRVYVHATEIRPEPPPGIQFGAVLPPPSVQKTDAEGKLQEMYEGEAVFQFPLSVSSDQEPGSLSLPVSIRYQACSENSCLFPAEQRTPAALRVRSAEPAAAGDSKAAEQRLAEPSEAPATVPLNPYENAARRFGFLGVLAAAFFWGLFASLTPCVYPMIPITVSVIGAAGSGKPLRGFFLSLIYVLGMSLTYAGFGVAAAWSGGLFGAVSDHPATRILISGVLILLALAMFDRIHIQMPAWVQSRIGRTGPGGRGGVFMTGMVAGMVVGPCVGPMLVGLLIYIAALGSKWQGFLIMWSFSLGMGMLFLAIGTFSGAVTALPRAGKWMIQIKHGFGILMMAMALYFIRPLMSQDWFYQTLGAFLIGLGVFAGAFDPMAAESPALDRLRKTAAILLLVVGAAYAAGFVFGEGLSRHGIHAINETSSLSWESDEGKALTRARLERKPIIIDFYADWCAACKKLDQEAFSNPAVIQAAAGFVPLRVDCSNPGDPSSEKLRQKYGVVGLPTIVFLGPSGQILADQSITRYVPAAFLGQHMQHILTISQG